MLAVNNIAVFYRNLKSSMSRLKVAAEIKRVQSDDSSTLNEIIIFLSLIMKFIKCFKQVFSR